MVCTQKKKSPNKRQFNQLDETSNDFVFGNGINANTLGNESSEPQANGR